jgi:outer membrane receptor protein involved in Fe transport
MIEAYGNFALGDNTAIRIAGVMDEEDGWFEHPVTGKDTFWRDNEALRGSILFEPSDTFRGRITLDWSTMESPGNYGTSTRLNDDDPTGLQNGLFGPLALNLIPGFPGGEGYWYWDLETGEGLDPYSRDIAVKSGQEYELEQYGLTAHFDWELSDTLTLRSITGYREIDSGSEGGDWDFGAVALAGLLNQFYDFETFSQEFLLEGDFDLAGESALSMVAGINYFTEDMDYLRQATVGDQFGFYLGNAWNGAFTPLGGGVNEFSGCDLANPFCVPLGAIGNPDFKFQDVEFAQTEDAIGLFLHLTYDINEQFSIIGGVRYTEVEKDAEVDNRVGANQDEYYDLVQQNQLGFFLAGAALMSPDWEADRKDDEWTYLGTLQYRPNDNMQLYASYSRGFKSGGFNFNEDAVGGTPSLTGTPDANFRFYSPLDFNGSEFDPEEVDAYELGWRWDINGAARLSVTLFKSEYEDLQVASFTGLKFVVFNAGSSDTEGVEIEADWAVTDNLTLTAAGTFLDATYGDDVEGLPAGRERGQTPDEALYFGARYTYPISSSLELYVNANYSYYSEMYLAEGTDEPLRSVTQDSYDLVSATLGIRNPGSWDLSAFCDNCFDEDYYEWAFNQPFQDAIAVNPAPPNLYGARFTIYF